MKNSEWKKFVGSVLYFNSFSLIKLWVGTFLAEEYDESEEEENSE